MFTLEFDVFELGLGFQVSLSISTDRSPSERNKTLATLCVVVEGYGFLGIGGYNLMTNERRLICCVPVN